MLLQLDFSSETPIYQQIRNQVVVAIAKGELSPGTRLPTIRALADESGINMMTASKAYQLLKSEGYISTDRRSGAVVNIPGGAAPVFQQKEEEQLRLLAAQARLGGMSLQEFSALCSRLFKEVQP